MKLILLSVVILNSVGNSWMYLSLIIQEFYFYRIIFEDIKIPIY